MWTNKDTLHILHIFVWAIMDTCLFVFGWAIMDTLNISGVSTFNTDVNAFLVLFVFQQPAKGRMKKFFCFNSLEGGCMQKYISKSSKAVSKALLASLKTMFKMK